VVVDVEGPVWVEGDGAALQQVMLNLLINALDALATIASPRIEVRVSSDDGDAILSVSDNGPGMSDVVADCVFEPFFTTKGERGTGLGYPPVPALRASTAGPSRYPAQPVTARPSSSDYRCDQPGTG